ncbi:cytidine deaminase [Devosia pacifica]|uniref:Cytidine deaminase n=1 Tax=Devosia pacifica TaxID=1335967 RepID=A0A918SEH0_9HYPH|nr:cytidine deaminase [Devosia pacifica]GHA37960.1 cytidine deaminase [Devosia pacifica]
MVDSPNRSSAGHGQFGELIAQAAASLRPHYAGDRLCGDVASVVVASDGQRFCGVCVDTASWGLCAERSALAAMIATGTYSFTEIVAVCREATTGRLHVLPPCGICREFMQQIDARNLDARVVLGEGEAVLLRDLLPRNAWPDPLPEGY